LGYCSVIAAARGKQLAVGTRLTLFSNDKPDRFFRVIKFWKDETSGIALALKTSLFYRSEDYKGRILTANLISRFGRAQS
jgi:hypothetical protein